MRAKKQISKERIAMLGAGMALLASACSVEVGGTPYAGKSWGELEVQKAIEAKSMPGMGGKKEAQLKVGGRVVGVCLAYPSWESVTIPTGFMKVRHIEQEYYVPTIAGYSDGSFQSTFQVSEDVLVKDYLRCNDARRA